MFLLGQQKPFRFSEVTAVPISHLNAGFLLYADVFFYMDLTSVSGKIKITSNLEGRENSMVQMLNLILLMWRTG
jgi:hypothetical protein